MVVACRNVLSLLFVSISLGVVAEASLMHRGAIMREAKIEMDDNDMDDDDDDAFEASDNDADNEEEDDADKMLTTGLKKPATGLQQTRLLQQGQGTRGVAAAVPAAVPAVAVPAPLPAPVAPRFSVLSQQARPIVTVQHVKPCATEHDKHKKEICMVERDLATNRDKQSRLTQSLQHVSDESESTKEIDASAVRVANETESAALASTLADMWKEMRMFDVPLYTEHIQDKIKALKQEETSLTAKLAALNQEGEQLNALDAGVHSRGSYFNFWSMSSTEKEAFFVGNLVYILGALCVAFMFHKARDKYPKYFSAEARPDVIRSPTRFSFGICGCINAPNICVLGFCCPFMTWASTLDRLPAHGPAHVPFFKAFLAMLLLALSSSYTYGMSAVILVALGVYYRQKIRMAYAIESNTQRTIFLDVLVWSFCQPCAIVQEAREAGVMLVDAP